MKDLLPVVLDIGAKSAGLLCIAWIAALFMRRQAALRHVVWIFALIAILALPGIELIPSPRPLATWHVPAAWSPTQPALMPAKPSLSIEPIASVERAVPATDSSRRNAYPPEKIGFIVWLSGAILLLLRSLSALWMLRRQTARTSEAGAGEPMAAVARQIAEQCRIRRWELRVGEEAFPPVAMTWGLWPKVVLPREAHEWTEQRLRVVLLHEFAHVRRRDFLWQLLAILASAGYWFHPLVWLACSQMRSAAETAADDFAIQSGIEPHAYADELVTIAGAVGRQRLGANHGLAIVRTSRLGSRVRAILDPLNRRRPLGIGYLVAALLTCTGALGFAYACRPAVAQESIDDKTVVIPAPKDVVPPLERPELAFLEEMGFGSPVYQNEAVENLRPAFDEKFVYPSWQYSIDSPGKIMSQQLRVSLTVEDGWKVSFPDSKRPYAAKADHVTDGRIDLHIEFFYDDLPWRERSYLVITDRSVVLEHRLDPHPMNAAGTPDKKLLGHLAQSLDKTPIHAEPKAASQVFYTLAP